MRRQIRSIPYRRMAERAEERWQFYQTELESGRWTGSALVELLTYVRDAGVAREMALAQLSAARGNGFCPCCGLMVG